MKILLVDDHPLVRAAMKDLLQEVHAAEPDEAGSCEEALLRTAKQSYDLVLLDLMMPGLNGLDALKTFRSAAPDVPVVVLSRAEDPDTILKALECGAMGFIPKSSSTQLIQQALKLVIFAKAVYVPPIALEAHDLSHISAETSRRDEVLGRFTPRERQVLDLYIRGDSYKEIARALDIELNTVKTHVAAVLQHLQVPTRAKAVCAAAKLGMSLESGAQRDP